MRRTLVLPLAATAAALLLPSSALAADATTLRLGGSAYQRLTAQKVRTTGVSGVSVRSARATLPVRRWTVKGSTATITHRGTLRLKVGKKTARLGTPIVRIGSSSRLTALVGGRRITVATIFAPDKVRTVGATGARAVAVPATLTASAAKRLRRTLGLRRTPTGRLGTITVSVGTVADSTPAAPTPAPSTPATPGTVVPSDPTPVDPTPVDPTPVDPTPVDPVPVSEPCPTATNGLTDGEQPGELPTAPTGATAVSGGEAAWGFSSTLRNPPNFLAYDPEDSATFIRRSYAGEAPCDDPYRTFVGDASQREDDTFGFGVGEGWYQASTGKAAVRLTGGFRIGYFVGGWRSYAPGTAYPVGQYRGLWARFSDAVVTIDGTTGTLSAYGDAGGNVPWRYAPLSRRALGALDLSGITPDTSVAGQVTWRDVPVRLTEEGRDLGIEYYEPGDALDPITVTVRTGDDR